MTPTTDAPATERSDLQSRPSYALIMDDILRDIAAGRLRPGDRLASEVQLRDQYGIGISTVKRGLDELAERGVLVRRRGSGTFVARQRVVPRDPVARDTVALLRAWDWRSYHPFYSELESGIRAELARRGWQHLDLAPWNGNVWRPGQDVNYRIINPAQLGHELAEHAETLGLIALPGADAPLRELAVDLPIITSRCDDDRPWAAYDWDRELERLLRLALQSGARRLAVFSSRAPEEIAGAAAAACRAAGRDAALVETLHYGYSASRHRSELTTRAHERARAAFADAAAPVADAIVVTSDIELQAVADALDLAPEGWQSARLYAQISRASQLQIARPWTALMADGQALGVALVDLLHARLTQPMSAPRYQRLNCHEVNWGG